MTYKYNTSYKTYTGPTAYVGKSAGYEKLVVYWLGTTIYDLNLEFLRNFISKMSRTHDQMHQAARSGKQCIVEGALALSVESNLKLTSVSRASYGELLEDYLDYLREKELIRWGKDDSRVISIRREKDLPNKKYKSYKTYTTYMKNPESFVNLMITLCYKQGYLLDQLLRALQAKFIQEGGFRENLFKKRSEYRQKNFYRT